MQPLTLNICNRIALSAMFMMVFTESAAFPQQIAWKPVSSTGLHTVVGNDIYLAPGGATVTLEVLVSGWGNAPGNPQLGVVYSTVDSAGYQGANASPPNPGVDLVPVGWPGNPSLGAYQVTDKCLIGGRDCSFGQPPCTEAESVCLLNPRFIFQDCPSLNAVDTTTSNYQAAAGCVVIPVPGQVDTGQVGYLFTLVLNVPSQAMGTYTINFFNDLPNFNFTFLNDPDANPIPIVSTVPAHIFIGGPFPAPAPFSFRKNRYLSFTPGMGSASAALQVTLVQSDYFAGSVGVTKWVGAPAANGIAPLVNAPLFRVWPEAVVHATGCEIVPATTYELRSTEDASLLSAPLTVLTVGKPNNYPALKWGDVTGTVSGGVYQPPDGFIGFVDVGAAVARFQGKSNAPHLTAIDIDPQITNGLANFADINRIIQGFQGQPYPFSAPANCP